VAARIGIALIMPSIRSIPLRPGALQQFEMQGPGEYPSHCAFRHRTGVTRWMALVALLGIGCAAPAQEGMITVAPGASERAMVMMRFGFLNVGGDGPGTAEVRRIARDELVPSGAAATGHIGDWMLENKAMVAVVGQIDGTSRGGRIVDAWRKPAGLDGLEDHETFVFGKLVVYDTLRKGFDVKTGAAYIEVSAVVDRTSDGLPAVSVATRYDLAPGIDTLLVHTQIKTIRGEVSAENAPPLLAERLQAQGSAEASVDATTTSTIGDAQGYLLHPLTLPAEIGADGTMARVSIPASATPAPGATFLFSRMIAPLERPDTLALAVARARIEGATIGEVRVQLSEGGRRLARLGVGDVVLRRPDGSEVVARGALPCPPESAYVVHVPEGTYAIGFQGSIHGAAPASQLEVKSDRLASHVTVDVAGSKAPYKEPPRAWRCQKSRDDELEPDID
jgi:hypothetical protein